APGAAWLEVRRLAAVRPARLDAVVRPDRYLERLFQVAIEVADQQRVAAVGVLVPALVRGRDALAGLLERLHRQLRGRRPRSEQQGDGRERSRRGRATVLQFCGAEAGVALASLALRFSTSSLKSSSLM